MVIEPAPLVTFMMRGVPLDFARSGAKAATVMAGPTVFVTNVVVSCSARDVESIASPVIAALLTRASMLSHCYHD
jgi:hypothetical protein